MKNKELKKDLISNGKYQTFTQIKRELYKNGIEVYENETRQIKKEYFKGITEEELKECERIRNNKTRQREKIERHIRYLFQIGRYDIYFVTFTFTDDVLKNTSKDTRKQKIRRILSQFDDYILNIDYGKKGGREHYHCIIAITKRNRTEYKDERKHLKLKELDSYNYGFYSVEKVKTENEDAKKLARYISKLTMHTIKTEQQYVSVKKGSDYVEYVREFDNYLKKKHGELGAMYDEEDSIQATLI